MQKMSSDNHCESQKKCKKIKKWIVVILALVVLILSTPLAFERQLNPELIATVRLDPARCPDGYLAESWYAVYGEYGLYPGTWVHPHENSYQDLAIDPWPEMDLENYTYIFCWRREIESLSYNILRENTAPFRTGAKTGNMVFREEIHPYTVFIYRIPKMRINHPDL